MTNIVFALNHGPASEMTEEIAIVSGSAGSRFVVLRALSGHLFSFELTDARRRPLTSFFETVDLGN
jgi:hypothetical protein